MSLISKINDAFTQVGTLLKSKVDKTRLINTGTGLTGGGDLSADRTLSLADSGVTAGTYGNASSVPMLAIDAKGRITSASTMAVTGGGGGSSSGGVSFNCGFQIGKPFSANFYDNTLFAPITSPQTIYAGNRVVFPVIFSEDLTIDQIGILARKLGSSSPDATFKILIFDVMPNGFPKQCVYASPILSITPTGDAFIAATANFTFSKGVVYWICVQAVDNNFNVQSLPSSHTLSFGNSSAAGTVYANNSKANAVSGAGNINTVVGGYFNYSSAGTRTYQTHGDAAITNANLVNMFVPRILVRAA